MTPISTAWHSNIFSAGNKTRARAGVTGGVGLEHEGWRGDDWGEMDQQGQDRTLVLLSRAPPLPRVQESAPHFQNCLFSVTPRIPVNGFGLESRPFSNTPFSFCNKPGASGFRGPCLSLGLSHRVGSPPSAVPTVAFKAVTGGRSLVTHTHP